MPKYTTRKAPGGPTPVEALKHGDKRKNIPTAELHDFMEKYEAATARTPWVPAVNNHASASLSTGSGFGRWAYREDFDPWNAQTAIREFLAGVA